MIKLVYYFYHMFLPPLFMKLFSEIRNKFKLTHGHDKFDLSLKLEVEIFYDVVYKGVFAVESFSSFRKSLYSSEKRR